MGLAANTARRGGVYWWRGRIGPGPQPSRIIARSLRTRDPEVARALGTQVTGMVALLRQNVRFGRMTVEEAEHEIGAFLAQAPFDVDPKVFDRLDADRRAPTSRAATPSIAYSPDQERLMLADFVRRTGPVLERRAADVRSLPTLVMDGEPEDWVAKAVHDDRIGAEACHLLALSGTSARVRAADRARLAEAGFGAAEIEEIDHLAREHAPREAASHWLIGPERDVIVFHLQAISAVATIENVARLRRATLFILAELLRAQARRYEAVPDGLLAIACGTLPIYTASNPIDAAAVQGLSIEPLDDPAARSTTVSRSPAVAFRAPASFLAKVDDLIRGKTHAKRREWDDKTGRQHRSVARLFVKKAGTDDPAAMTQANIGQFFDLLAIIPTHWGKSADDEHRTIEEMVARSDNLDDEEIGLSANTFNRYRTQLGTILKYLEEHGFQIGGIKTPRATDPESPSEKRNAFTVADGVQLMHIIDCTTRAGDCLDPDSLFWVPVLCWYLGLRLAEAAGLALNDVVGRLISIRNNALRRVKTRSSIRNLPVTPEMERLGFLQYVERRRSEGAEALFPNLFGGRMPFDAVFAKSWTPLLDLALPTARSERKTLHSTRKGANSAMHVLAVKDNTRLYIMGHAKPDVNAQHYLLPPSSHKMLEALSFISIVTAGVNPRFASDPLRMNLA